MGSSQAAQRKCDMCHAEIGTQKHSQSQTNEKRRKRKQQIKKEEHKLTFAQGANVVIHLLTTEPAHRIKEVGVILFTIH